MSKTHVHSESVNMGFQIAPMIDVVFVIMLFFMVMAGSVKVEREFKTTLPASSPNVEDNDELRIIIDEAGLVTMNEEEFDAPADKTLPDLTLALVRLKQDADARGSQLLVTLETEDQVKYERIIDVMNALAKAKIPNVTFTVGSEEF